MSINYEKVFGQEDAKTKGEVRAITAQAFDEIEYEEVKDSGERENFKDGSRRDTQKGKGRFDLIPPILMFRLAKHYENGAVKYGDDNWKLGQPSSRYMSSALRHIFGYIAGKRDEDHLVAAIWNLISIMWNEQYKPKFHNYQEGQEGAVYED